MELNRRFLGRLTALAASAVFVGGAFVAPRATADVRPGGFMSSNVEWVATIPLDSPGVGGRVVTVGDQTRFYVTGVKGLSIYDVTDPTLPLVMSTVPLPHWENEDVEVSADGSRVIVSGERVSGGATVPGFGPTYVIDATIPQAPLMAKVLTVGSHTISCVDAECDWIYSSSGEIYDLRDLAAPQRILKGASGWEAKAESQIGEQLEQTAHDLNQDAAGYVITDTMPRLMLDVSDPENPVVKARSDSSVGGEIAYQHNNLRPGAEAWTPRATNTAYQPGETLLPGEILYANGETNFTVDCDGATNGPFATWSVKNWDKGQRMELIDVFRPQTGTYENGDPAVNVLGCSGHWFTERNGLVAAGWYDHGTRFLRVDDTGQISEVGFFQPVVGAASAAHWVTDEVVYVVDYERGIDILRFDRDAAPPSAPEIAAAWMVSAGGTSSPAAVAEQYFCRLAQES